MVVLAIPASSASVERVFSLAGGVISDDRSRLKPDLASKLIFLRASWEPLEDYLSELEKKRKSVK